MHAEECGHHAALNLLAQGQHGKAHADLLKLIEQAITASLQGQASSSQARYHDKPTLFHGHKIPSISLMDYLLRIAKHTEASAAAFTAALLYIDVVCRRDPLLGPDHRTVHRLVLVAVLLAAKFWDDDVYTNTFYAQVGGITTSDLHHMELDMFSRLSYQLLVPDVHLARVAGLLTSGQIKIGPAGTPGLSDWLGPHQQPSAVPTTSLHQEDAHVAQVTGSSPPEGISPTHALETDEHDGVKQPGRGTGSPVRVLQAAASSAPAPGCGAPGGRRVSFSRDAQPGWPSQLHVQAEGSVKRGHSPDATVVQGQAAGEGEGCGPEAGDAGTTFKCIRTDSAGSAVTRHATKRHTH